MLQFIRATWLPLTLTISFGAINDLATDNLLIQTVSFIGATIFAIDLVGRTKDYIMLNDKKKNGRCRKIYWDLFSKTRCSREVMCAVDPNSKDYYNKLGYKWYHFLPDDTFSKSSPLLTWKFWKNLMLTKIKK